MEIEESRAFALLQQGMKDRVAYRICLVLSLDTDSWNAFEQYAKDELNAQDDDAALSLAKRVAGLNPRYPAIGDGMLASLVEDARRITGAARKGETVVPAPRCPFCGSGPLPSGTRCCPAAPGAW